MNFVSDGPRISSRLWVRTASVESYAAWLYFPTELED